MKVSQGIHSGSANAPQHINAPAPELSNHFLKENQNSSVGEDTSHPFYGGLLILFSGGF